jgi:BirA family biotin operon repressor/biotin-[acetyl-CoA-carboxylase] ligase
MDERSITTALAGLSLPSLHYFSSIGSTNDFASSLIEKDAPDGALVVADEQTQGRGRLDRRWETRPGSAIAFSLVIHPEPHELPFLGLFPALCGLAVCATLRDRYILAAQVKWPNDVLIRRRKTCGVLVEAHWSGSQLLGLVAGIGVNISPGSVLDEASLVFPATCVESELGRPVDRETLLAEILAAFYSWRLRLGSEEFLTAWENWLAFKDEWVRVEQPAGPVNGRLLGVAPDGSLRLRTEAGQVLEIAVGDVRLRPA